MVKDKLLVIVAHPDDAELMFGGTISKYTRKGNHVDILIVTSGEGWNTLGNEDLNEVIEIRKEEALKASKILGVRNIIFLGLKDGYLNKYELVSTLVDEVRKVNPNYILTHCEEEGHYDHKETSSAVKRICNINGEPAPIINPYWDSKYAPVSSFKGLYTYNPYVNGVTPCTFYLSLEKVDIERKIKAVLCYRSQFPDIESTTDRIMTEAHLYGIFSCNKYAEALRDTSFASPRAVDFLKDNF